MEDRSTLLKYAFQDALPVCQGDEWSTVFRSYHELWMYYE